MAALPGRYQYGMPGSSASGRSLQGDAVYVRDLASPEFQSIGLKYSRGKILKAALIFDMMGLYDHVADLVITFQDVLGNERLVEIILDHVASQSPIANGQPANYREYMEKFEADDPTFYS